MRTGGFVSRTAVFEKAVLTASGNIKEVIFFIQHFGGEAGQALKAIVQLHRKTNIGFFLKNCNRLQFFSNNSCNLIAGMGVAVVLIYGKCCCSRVAGLLQLALKEGSSETRFPGRTTHGIGSVGDSSESTSYPCNQRSCWIPAAHCSEKKEIFAIQFFLLIFMQPIAT